MLKVNFFETERLVLKRLKKGEGKAVCKYYQQNKLFLKPYEASKTEEFYTEKFQNLALEFEEKLYNESRSIRFWIFKKNNPLDIIGSVSLSQIVRGPFQSCYLGYKLNKDDENQGYMSEAIEKMINIAFNELDLHRIEAHVMLKNTASIKVLQKNKFVLEGKGEKYLKINGKWEDHYHFALIKND